MEALEGQLALPQALSEPVPVTVEWFQGGDVVELAGEFNKWQRLPMQRVAQPQKNLASNSPTHRLTVVVPRGVYQYKFVVDGEWRCAAGVAQVADERGLRNHELQAAGGFVRAMSFNIRYANSRDGPHLWPNRAAAVAAMLRAAAPDVLGLQEALAGQLADLRAALPQYDCVGVGRDDGHSAGEFAPVLFLRRKFELRSHRTLWLSETPEQPGSRSWGAACVRIGTLCLLRNRLDAREYLVCNTHLDHVSGEARLRGLQLLLSAISQVSAHCTKLLMGDFNCSDRDPPHAAAAAVMDDTRATAEQRLHQYRNTFCDFSAIGRPPQPANESTIDYIFVSRGVRVLRHCIPNVHLPQVQLSDHRPVIVDLVG